MASADQGAGQPEPSHVAGGGREMMRLFRKPVGSASESPTRHPRGSQEPVRVDEHRVQPRALVRAQLSLFPARGLLEIISYLFFTFGCFMLRRDCRSVSVC